MAPDQRWAQPPAPRHQLILVSQSVDDLVPAEHPIRQLDVLLDAVDWTDWESGYSAGPGRPPLHPRYMAGAILYGLMRGVRSSRELEDAARERLDFIWFLEGQQPDHATFARFRTRHGEALAALNRQIAQRIVTAYEGALESLVLDGTRVRANSARRGARTAEALDRQMARCLAELTARLEALKANDDEAGEAPGQLALGGGCEGRETAVACDAQTARQAERVARLERARAVAEERDAAKRKDQGKKATAVRVPVTDPDAQFVPNKEGGYAPNYAPIAVQDHASGGIVDYSVPAGSEEAEAVQSAVAHARALGGTPQRLASDSQFATNENLAALEGQGIQAAMPTGLDASPANPANRADLEEPVPEADHAGLPQRRGRFAIGAFVYDPARDGYFCPAGQFLAATGQTGRCKNGTPYRRYRCPNQGECPHRAKCTKSQDGRRAIKRLEHQDARERLSQYMATEKGQAHYRQRAPGIEGFFGVVKHVFGIRQFLLRGLEKVRIEWAWICGAFNLKKLLNVLASTAKDNAPATNTTALRHGSPIVGLFVAWLRALAASPGHQRKPRDIKRQTLTPEARGWRPLKRTQDKQRIGLLVRTGGAMRKRSTSLRERPL